MSNEPLQPARPGRLCHCSDEGIVFKKSWMQLVMLKFQTTPVTEFEFWMSPFWTPFSESLHDNAELTRANKEGKIARYSTGLRQCLHFSHSPFENILLIGSIMLECFFTNLLLMHVKLTPTAIGVVRRKSPKGERGSVSHEGPWAIWILLYFIVASEGELIQCCTQNFPNAEGELIKCNTKKSALWP